jgi:MoaA/NifB/PqqE/SkfB family radical SAM enzyme
MKLPKLDLNITNRCNLRCVHCAFDSGIVKMKELSLKKIKQILEDTKKLGGERIDITGGEPLVRKDVFEIIKIAKDLDYKIELVTNGTLLDRFVIEKLIKLKVDSIAVSLDGSNYEMHNRIRGITRDQYDEIIKNIKLAIKHGIKTKINTVVFESNLEDTLNITKFAIENNVYEHGLYYFSPIGRGVRYQEKSVEPVKWLKFIRNEFEKYQDKIKLSLEFPMIEKNKLSDKLGCIANNERAHIQILPDGNIFPCAICASFNKPVANLNKVNIKYVWQNETLWDKYWKDVQENFCGVSCVDFREFDINDYEKYKFICPLRKFAPGDII